MAAPPAAPTLRAPLTYGARPSSPFLFSIPASGQSPLTFSATGLPAGLTIAASTGIISGTTPAAGSYPVDVTATNSAGSATATYTIVSGNTLALTPPMGWNSYDSFGASVTEQEMIDEAMAVKQYLQPFGWNTVVIDYRWYEPGQPIDANGRYLPATSKYPSATGSNGFKPLADRIHAIGLNFGIHIMRGVPRKSYTANNTIAGSTYHDAASGEHERPVSLGRSYVGRPRRHGGGSGLVRLALRAVRGVGDRLHQDRRHAEQHDARLSPGGGRRDP